MGRGSMVRKTSGNIALVQWNDNNIVTLASTSHGLHPITKVDWIAVVNKKLTKITVACPQAVCVYNKFIGGVDRFDENLHG